jgi:hypothetical protein
VQQPDILRANLRFAAPNFFSPLLPAAAAFPKKPSPHFFTAFENQQLRFSGTRIALVLA